MPLADLLGSARHIARFVQGTRAGRSEALESLAIDERSKLPRERWPHIHRHRPKRVGRVAETGAREYIVWMLVMGDCVPLPFTRMTSSSARHNSKSWREWQRHFEIARALTPATSAARLSPADCSRLIVNRRLCRQLALACSLILTSSWQVASTFPAFKEGPYWSNALRNIN
jgi:hypothetical protein